MIAAITAFKLHHGTTSSLLALFNSCLVHSLYKTLCCHRFQEAMAQYTVDHVARMRQLKNALDQSDEDADAVQQKENMLEELLDIVDNIDYARGSFYMLLL